MNRVRDQSDNDGARHTVCVVDSHVQTRQTVLSLVQSIGVEAISYDLAARYLKAYDLEHSRAACLVLGLYLQDMSGLDLQKLVVDRGGAPRIIIICDGSDTSAAVQGMKHGAHDVISRPFSNEQLLGSIRKALAIDQRQDRLRVHQDIARQRIASLTFKERETLALLVAGHASKQIAFRLSVAEKTIEARRCRIRDKMQTESIAELVLMVTAACGGHCGDEENICLLEPADTKPCHFMVDVPSGLAACCPLARDYPASIAAKLTVSVKSVA